MVDDRAIVQREVDRLGFDLPQAVTTGNLLEAVDLNGVPSFLFVTREGRIVGFAEGDLSERSLERAISALAGP